MGCQGKRASENALSFPGMVDCVNNGPGDFTER
jgi:hypothetical protein